MRVDFSVRATQQLTEILVYFDRRNGSKSYSDRLLDKIIRKLEKIDHDIILGVQTHRKNVYQLRVENYVIEYRIHSDRVEAVAIFDARRNVHANQFGL